ncbi:MAG: hybrid sensor histidine kinase/response regulator [Leptospiraceae bacterium]|nr:hybrid sensor histidine kinase/response regulator [Leptospiraceae bacterium]
MEIKEENSILIVDDKPDNLKVLINFLKETGYSIRVAKNGEKAIEYAEEYHPSIILLDVLMPPGIDGYETCLSLKEKQETKDIPIIFMTALSDTTDKVKGFHVGGVDYITKPLQKEEVLARVNAHLTIRTQKEKLRIQNEELAIALKIKNKFFSIIAHDLKSPFNALLNLSELLYGDIMKQEVKQELIKEVHDTSKQAYNLLKNLLEWSGSQLGSNEPELQTFNLKEVVDRNLQLAELNAKGKNIQMSSDVSESLNVRADKNMLDTIIRNLLSNSIKFTYPNGKIDINARQDNDFIQICVSDTGVGMEKEDIPRLFRIDIKHSTLGTSKEKGTGLGLMLCKEFIEKHGGSIVVESEVGKGSKFFISLPI